MNHIDGDVNSIISDISADTRVYDNHVYELLPNGYDELDVQTVKKIIDQDTEANGKTKTSQLMVLNQNLEVQVRLFQIKVFVLIQTA